MIQFGSFLRFLPALPLEEVLGSVGGDPARVQQEVEDLLPVQLVQAGGVDRLGDLAFLLAQVVPGGTYCEAGLTGDVVFGT